MAIRKPKSKKPVRATKASERKTKTTRGKRTVKDRGKKKEEKVRAKTWGGIVGKGFTQEQFKAYCAGIKFNAWRPQFIVTHNTAIPKLADWHKYPGATRMRGLEGYYKSLGWGSGPHLFVADDLIWVFSPLTAPGTHSPSWNSMAWGVEIVGDFSTEPFTGKIRDNAISALATLHSLRGLNPDNMRFHKEDTRTTHKGCPGKNMVKADLIKAVKERMRVRNPGDHVIAADVEKAVEDIINKGKGKEKK